MSGAYWLGARVTRLPLGRIRSMDFVMVGSNTMLERSLTPQRLPFLIGVSLSAHDSRLSPSITSNSNPSFTNHRIALHALVVTAITSLDPDCLANLRNAAIKRFVSRFVSGKNMVAGISAMAVTLPNPPPRPTSVTKPSRVSSVLAIRAMTLGESTTVFSRACAISGVDTSSTGMGSPMDVTFEGPTDPFFTGIWPYSLLSTMTWPRHPGIWSEMP